MKTKNKKALGRKTLIERAKNLLKSGRYYNHIGFAMPAKSQKYKTGDQVYSLDPWKCFEEPLTFVKSLRWLKGGGGYLCLNKFGRPLTTTNVRHVAEVVA